MSEYDSLKFTNDFMFCKILTSNQELCKELVELILGKKISRISYSHDQENIEITPDGKGVRLDVYLEDSDSVYDVEMQTVMDYHLGKRSRYYQGMIDLNLIGRGAAYKELKQSYVIFICLNNPFKNGLHKYTFGSICYEDHATELGDDAYKVIITPDGTADDVSEEMQNFLKYIAGGEPVGNLPCRIENDLVAARNKVGWRQEYMTLEMRDRENVEKGFAQGLEQGLEQGIGQGIEQGVDKEHMSILTKMIAAGIPVTQIIACGYTQEEIDTIKMASKVLN